MPGLPTSRTFSPAAINARVWSWKQIWRDNLGLKNQSNSGIRPVKAALPNEACC